MKLNDLTGKTYNRLTVIERDYSRKGVYWRCRCECGNVVSVRAYNLTTESTKSCGCLEKAAGKNNVEKLHQLARESGSTPNILREKANANNRTTGVRGVTYNASSGKYVAYIGYQSKRYTLCRSTDINKCIKAREEAEKAIREDFSEWYENFKNEEG